MAGIAIDRNAKTLKADALSGLGVRIDDMHLTCDTCGESFALPVPWSSGAFPRDWYACPGGCNAGRPGMSRGR